MAKAKRNSGTWKQTKNKGGRPKIVLTQVEIDQIKALASCGCTNDEIVAVIALSTPISKTSLVRSFGAVIKKGRDSRNARLRHAQFKQAMAGNVTMQIWLGKQYLGQKDKSEFSSPDDEPPQEIRLTFIDK